MRMMVAAVVGVLTLGGAAQASERTAYAAIASGDLAKAEQTLNAERRIFPDRPDLMLNLAAIYAQTGRADAARDLYRSVQASSPILMRMPSGATVSSHAVAERGLEKLTPTFASR